MCSHELKVCPRCNDEFECKAGTVLQCQCSMVILTAAERDHIEKMYNDCLCAACLEEIKSESGGGVTVNLL